MRLWSIHPKYLDAKGLVALWRESLLAKKVLEGKTKGYTKHPELDRFKESKDPLGYINSYLLGVYEEACERGYSFDKSKIGTPRKGTIKITKERVTGEFGHLMNKLEKRDPERFKELRGVKKPKTHPLFVV